MAIGHFPPVSRKCHIVTWSNVTLFRNGRKMSHGHMWHFTEMGGKCLMVICDTFQKWEENVPWSYVTLFRNGRKMSHGHMWHFSEMGGKCPLVMCYNFQKRGENVHWSIVTIFWNWRKLSCASPFLQQEENVPCLLKQPWQKQVKWEEIILTLLIFRTGMILSIRAIITR